MQKVSCRGIIQTPPKIIFLLWNKGQILYQLYSCFTFQFSKLYTWWTNNIVVVWVHIMCIEISFLLSCFDTKPFKKFDTNPIYRYNYYFYHYSTYWFVDSHNCYNMFWWLSLRFENRIIEIDNLWGRTRVG